MELPTPSPDPDLHPNLHPNLLPDLNPNLNPNLNLYQVMDLLGNMRNGTFVKIGGNDGLSTTNTYHLERCLGWQGLLIEGHPENFNKMVKARPGALNLGTAV